jgi:hypothetical protein
MLLEIACTRPTTRTPSGIKSSAGLAADIHCAREPARDDCAETQNANEDSQVEQQFFQLFRLSPSLVW